MFHFFTKNPQLDPAYDIYTEVMRQSRLEIFYKEWGVPDTLEGRFELLALHLCLIFTRFKSGSTPETDFSQSLFDTTFREIDRTLREMGVGDLSVPKKIKKYAESLYGRMHAYSESLENQKDTLGVTIARNVYADENFPVPEAFLNYVNTTYITIKNTPSESFLKGKFQFQN